MAHKKAWWSSKNLKDSKPKYRWVKVFWWQKVLAWNIIIRQKWNKFECGKNVYMWRDFTILSMINWLVSFKKKNIKRFDGRIYLKTVVEVFPLDALIDWQNTVAKKAPVEKKVVAKKAPVEKKIVAKKAPAEKKVATKKAPAEKKVATKKAPTKDVK
jgi:large subunit ribosomal protein L27